MAFLGIFIAKGAPAIIKEYLIEITDNTYPQTQKLKTILRGQSSCKVVTLLHL